MKALTKRINLNSQWALVAVTLALLLVPGGSLIALFVVTLRTKGA